MHKYFHVSLSPFAPFGVRKGRVLGSFWSRGEGNVCRDGVTAQSPEKISFLVAGFPHCPPSSQWPWVVFPLPEHPQPYSLQCSQPAAVPFKKQCQLSRNCSTNLRASCVFVIPVLLWSRLGDWMELATGFGRAGLGHWEIWRVSTSLIKKI